MRAQQQQVFLAQCTCCPIPSTANNAYLLLQYLSLCSLSSASNERKRHDFMIYSCCCASFDPSHYIYTHISVCSSVFSSVHPSVLSSLSSIDALFPGLFAFELPSFRNLSQRCCQLVLVLWIFILLKSVGRGQEGKDKERVAGCFSFCQRFEMRQGCLRTGKLC